MNTKTIARLLFVVSFVCVVLAPHESLAEKTLALIIGQEPGCEKLTPSGKPSSGGYDLESVWVQKPGIVNYVYDDDKGEICFEPLGVGSTRVKVTGMVHELKRNKQLKYSNRFYRNFRVRVRSR